MTTDTRAVMAALGRTTVAEILGNYEALLDERHDLEIEALGLRNEGESLGSARSLANRQSRNDVERRLGLYSKLAAEAGRLIGAAV